MQLFFVHLQSGDYEIAMDCINLKNIELLEDVIKVLHSNRFMPKIQSETPELVALENGTITQEEYNELMSSNKEFCFSGDFDCIYSDFLEFYNIDLIDNEICWFKFKMLFTNLQFKENGAINKRLSIRGFKPNNSKGYEDYNKSGQYLKDLYSL